VNLEAREKWSLGNEDGRWKSDKTEIRSQFRDGLCVEFSQPLV